MGPAILLGFGVLLMLATVWVWKETRRRASKRTEPSSDTPAEEYPTLTAARVPYAVMVEEKAQLDVVPFLGISERVKGQSVWRGYGCPKCLFRSYTEVPIEMEMQLCACSDYSREHFHFECVACGYVAVMKTADDVAEAQPTTRRSAQQSVAVKCN